MFACQTLVCLQKHPERIFASPLIQIDEHYSSVAIRLSARHQQITLVMRWNNAEVLNRRKKTPT
jgi:hypothetical protein